jgi:two-component system response regulator (stage 0 sporulation protein F)
VSNLRPQRALWCSGGTNEISPQARFDHLIVGRLPMAKILVVDDEEHIRLLYSEELTEAGYEVITAADGYKLTERIEKEQPDLVILDIKMIDYNGLDLLQEIRNKFYDLPVILCTAYDTFKEDIKSIAADFYVIKSFDLTELKKKIAKALETHIPLT